MTSASANDDKAARMMVFPTSAHTPRVMHDPDIRKPPKPEAWRLPLALTAARLQWCASRRNSVELAPRTALTATTARTVTIATAFTARPVAITTFTAGAVASPITATVTTAT